MAQCYLPITMQKPAAPDWQSTFCAWSIVVAKEIVPQTSAELAAKQTYHTDKSVLTATVWAAKMEKTLSTNFDSDSGNIM